MDLNQVTLPARDLAASIAFYRRMGFEQIVDDVHYARFKSLVGTATFSLHADPDAVPSTTLIYFECTALDLQVAELEAKGIVVSQQPRVERANALLICTPEYAHGMPGSLKNALDWLVSAVDVADKPVLLVSASPGGAAHAHAQLSEV